MGVARLTAGLSSATLTAAGWAFGLIVTALVLWTPLLVSGYRNPSADLVLDSIDACIALLVAYLVYGRFARQRRLQDLLLANGLVLLAVPGLGLSYAAEALGGTFTAGTLDVWLPLVIRIMGAMLIAAAALAGLGRAPRITGAHASVILPIAVTVVVAVLCLVLWLARLKLPVALDHGYVPSSAQQGIATGYFLLPIAHGVATVCFFVASVAFTAQASRRGDALLRWLGPACALAGFARLHYMMFPSLYSDWLYTGDLLRTGCYVLLLTGAARELRQYWNSQSRAAVLDDRRRLARELHDGVIQELSYIRSESHAIPADAVAGVRSAELTAARIVAACDRALDETRAAVQALGRAEEEPLGFMLHRTAREMAERYVVQLEVDLDDAINASPDQKHALMRITREAVSNAVHHGKAQRVVVCLRQDEGRRRLTIEDDGRGFDVAAAVSRNTGYGLVSMRERARALPGSFDVAAMTGRGSVVTVRW